MTASGVLDNTSFQVMTECLMGITFNVIISISYQITENLQMSYLTSILICEGVHNKIVSKNVFDKQFGKYYIKYYFH